MVRGCIPPNRPYRRCHTEDCFARWCVRLRARASRCRQPLRSPRRVENQIRVRCRRLDSRPAGAADPCALSHARCGGERRRVSRSQSTSVDVSGRPGSRSANSQGEARRAHGCRTPLLYYPFLCIRRGYWCLFCLTPRVCYRSDHSASGPDQTQSGTWPC
jgi:hypothetical protein